MTGDEARAIRIRLGLSVTGMAVLLRMGESGGSTISKWERGEPPPVVGALLYVISRSAAARVLLGARDLRARYPHGVLGRPPAKPTLKRRRSRAL